MMEFNWFNMKLALAGFGGEQIKVFIQKTGLPFFDVLRLYGAIDLYIGVREDVVILDKGDKWEVVGKSRRDQVKGKDEKVFRQVWAKKKPEQELYCKRLRSALTSAQAFQEEVFVPATKAFSGLDSTLQAGIRGVAASKYTTLQTGQASESTYCVVKIPLSDGFLAFAGKKRIEKNIGNVTFLPVFEGKVDLSKVINPLRAWIGVPNVLCTQALVLLVLKTSLFAEGYQDRLTSVVFNTFFGRQRSDNYSGLITIASTAVGKMRSSNFTAHVYNVFRELVAVAWKRQGRSFQATTLTPDALRMAYWLIQPVGKNLSMMITSQEQLRRRGFRNIFANAQYVKEVFKMSYGDWKGDYETVQKFAKAVASGIYYARIAKEKKPEDRRKVWYDEVTMLRSTPSAKALIERAMILVEQGHRENSQVGTVHRNEVFDPQKLLLSIGSERDSFETFRDLFRMFLVQESTYQVKEAPITENDGMPAEEGLQIQQEEEEKE